MKYNRFFIARLCLMCAGLILISCQKSPKFSVSSNEVIIDAFPVGSFDIDITSDVDWKVTEIKMDDKDWLTVSPLDGKGDGLITLKAEENHAFTSRSARIAVSGTGVKTDTIWVTQMSDMDIKGKIVDQIFREYCLNEFDNDPKDGILSMKEARSAGTINVSKMHISRLDGIEYFTKLRTLNCSYNDLERLDVRQNKDLTELNCYFNSIKSLDVSNNSELRTLHCSYNPISKIDVSGLEKLMDLEIYNAEITEIDVSHNAKLAYLAISNNKVANVDVSNNKELQGLECNENGLATLNVSSNPKLRYLYCGNNKLTTLNLENNSSLTNLWCNYNQLTGISLGNLTNLQFLMCSNNPFTNGLELRYNTNLTELYCSAIHLSTLSLSNNLELKQLHCDGNQLTTLDLKNNTLLEGLRCSNNNIQNEINIVKNKKLTYIDIRNNPNLITIYVWSDFIAGGDYSKDQTAQWDKTP